MPIFYMSLVFEMVASISFGEGFSSIVKSKCLRIIIASDQ